MASGSEFTIASRKTLTALETPTHCHIVVALDRLSHRKAMKAFYGQVAFV